MTYAAGVSSPGPDMSIRLIILVSGPPAAGKTTLAAALADALNLPLIGKDDIKETLADALGRPAGDLAWSRRTGGAAMEVLWRLAGRCPAAVLEANFRPRSEYEQSHLRQLRARVIEVHCLCPPDESARRFSARAETAHPAHPLTELTAELLAEFDRPMTTAEVISIDTSQPVNMAALAAHLTSLIDVPADR